MRRFPLAEAIAARLYCVIRATIRAASRPPGVKEMQATQLPVPGQQPEEFDPVDIQREAAMFYGLFLRGQPVESLRRDIEIPRQMFEKWLKHPCYDGHFRDNVKRIYHFRRKVLAVFEELVDQARLEARIQ